MQLATFFGMMAALGVEDGFTVLAMGDLGLEIEEPQPSGYRKARRRYGYRRFPSRRRRLDSGLDSGRASR